MTDLRDRLSVVGDKLREDLSRLTYKEQTSKSDAIDLMSAGRDRKNDTVYTEEKIIEKI